MKSRIIQLSAGFLAGDAISNEMIAIDNYFSKKNYNSFMFASNIGKFNNLKTVRRLYKYRMNSNDILIYHHSIHSSILKKIEKLPVKKILIYHNITPYSYFEPYSIELTHFLKKGREELGKMRNLFDVSLADSTFNANELLKLGFQNVKVMPILYEFEKLKKFNKFKEKKKRIIFVGRIVPNKKQDDLIRFAAVFKKYITNQFEIELIGYCPKELLLYKEELERMIKYYDLKENVKFSNYVDEECLFKKYSNADLFLSMSEHEGFCVPLIEAMFYDIPILAYKSSAIEETLDGAGILFKEKDYARIVLMAEKLLFDDKFRQIIIDEQRRRIVKFQQSNYVKMIEDEINI